MNVYYYRHILAILCISSLIISSCSGHGDEDISEDDNALAPSDYVEEEDDTQSDAGFVSDQLSPTPTPEYSSSQPTPPPPPQAPTTSSSSHTPSSPSSHAPSPLNTPFSHSPSPHTPLSPSGSPPSPLHAPLSPWRSSPSPLHGPLSPSRAPPSPSPTPSSGGPTSSSHAPSPSPTPSSSSSVAGDTRHHNIFILESQIEKGSADGESALAIISKRIEMSSTSEEEKECFKKCQANYKCAVDNFKKARDEVKAHHFNSLTHSFNTIKDELRHCLDCFKHQPLFQPPDSPINKFDASIRNAADHCLNILPQLN